MSYQINLEQLNPDQYKITITLAKKIITFQQFTKLLRNRDFAHQFSQTLLLPFDYFFETNMIDDLTSPVIIILTQVTMKASQNSRAFMEYFKSSESVVSFLNLTKDVKLIVPRPTNLIADYLNLRTFLATAPFNQILDFWEKVAQEAEDYLSNNPQIYLKTHGLMVPWLHFRLQTDRKYYVTKEKDY